MLVEWTVVWPCCTTSHWALLTSAISDTQLVSGISSSDLSCAGFNQCKDVSLAADVWSARQAETSSAACLLPVFLLIDLHISDDWLIAFGSSLQFMLFNRLFSCYSLNVSIYSLLSQVTEFLFCWLWLSVHDTRLLSKE